MNKKCVIGILALFVFSIFLTGCETKYTQEELDVKVAEGKIEARTELDKIFQEQLETAKEELNTQIQEKEQQITDLLEEIENIEKFNKYYSQGLTEFNFAIFDSYDADYNYNLWSWYYDQGYFFDAVDYCIGARTLYSSSNGRHQKAISYFEEADENAKEKYKELVSYYIKASDVAIDINWAMYETCEYFESACNFYDRGLYDSGDGQLEEGNKKIKKHDSLVKTYNSYLSKIEVLEENI